MHPGVASSVSSVVLVLVVGLAGCGGGGPINELGPPSGIPGVRPAPGTATYHPVSPLEPGRYTFSGELGNAVRIGIEDSPVDFTNPRFHGRVALEGAAFSYWRPLAGQPAQNAFAACTEADPCRVFHGDSGSDRATLEQMARTVLEHEGLPDGDDRWFLHDRSRGEQGWYELPGVDQYEHGTTVATIALGGRTQPYPGPEPVIVPMARNLDQDIDQLEPQHYFSQLIDALEEADSKKLDEIYDEHAAAIGAQHDAADIINASYGRAVDINSVPGRNALRTWIEDLQCLAGEAPDPDVADFQCRTGTRSPTPVWEEYVQENTKEKDLTLRVWAAGNHEPATGVPPSILPDEPYAEFPNVLAGDGHRNLDALGPFHFPELRGEHIAVTGLSTDEERLAPWANPCGALPSNWRTEGWKESGVPHEHFCLAAPVPRGLEGTSFAAPFVSGVLARMEARFPGVTPRELVWRLMHTADGWEDRDAWEDQDSGMIGRGHGFDGDVYVAEIKEIAVDDLVITIDDVTIPLDMVSIVGDPAFQPGDHVVVQRGCTGSPANYLVSTGGENDLCVVWGEPGGTREMAEMKAAERFAFLYGAGRVDVDAHDPDEPDERAGVFAPMSPPRMPTASGRSAPVASTRLRTPAAYGALSPRLSGIAVAGFDAGDFPFFYRASDFVADATGLEPAIPEFLPEPSGPSACRSLQRLAPGLVCTPPAGGASLHALVLPDGAGAAWRLSEGVALSAFTRREGRLDGAASGAFSFDGGSSLTALRLGRGWTLGGSDRWRLHGTLALAADLPRGLGARRGSIFEAGPALLSDWSLALTHASRDRRTRLVLSQPPRAEAGHGRLTVPSGRLEDRSHLYETHRLSLVPSHRQLTLRLSHQRPLLGGDLVASAHRTENPGHARAGAHHGAGLAWRRSF